MKGRSALPWVAFLTGMVIVAGGIAGTHWGRRLLTRVDYFDVRRVEVVGTRWVAPDALLELAAIRGGRSVWEDYTDVEMRLVEHPLIDEAQVRRAGWRSLRIVVRETEPVAFVGVPELRAVHGDGTVIPLDLAGTELDLPLITEEASLAEDSSRVVAGPALEALEIFVSLNELDPGLGGVVSDFGLAQGAGLWVNLVASQPARRLALPDRVDERLVRRIRATLDDLRRRGIAADLIEARFAGIIVVRRERL
ncbi:MAG: FtsQ-type POTRA domain-containing protein [Gemmatimonadota bacterium]|nr:MAG: FtsQ-type POTRA domain-containing protein [Gemmatimonadota bacterium]